MQDIHERDPVSRLQLLEEYIARRFENGVADKEDRKRQIVLTRSNANILVQTHYAGIADVRAIQEGDEIQETQPGHKVQIDLP